MLKYIDLPETLLSADGMTLLEDVANLVQQTLTAFASGDNFEDIIAAVFGEAYDAEALESLRQQWAAGDFESLPEIRILSSDVLGNANGAFSAETGEIYLAEMFLAQTINHPKIIAKVLLEEIGHFIDEYINIEDTSGDEGRHFSSLLLEPNKQIDFLSYDEDLDVIKISESLVAIEKNDDFVITGSVSWLPTNIQPVPEGFQPARRVKVEVKDSTGIFTLASTVTDESGDFSFSGLPRESSYTVVVYAEGENHRILDKNENPIFVQKVIDVDLDDSPPAVVSFALESPDESRVFSISDALSTAEDYSQNIRRSTDFVEVIFDKESKDGDPYYIYRDSRMHIPAGYANSWNVIHHEYGHFIADLEEFDSRQPIIDSNHVIDESSIGTGSPLRNKQEGSKLGWREGLANYLSLAIQGTSHLEQSPDGFSRFFFVDGESTFFMENEFFPESDIFTHAISLEQEDGLYPSLGEGGETAIARILYDIADEETNIDSIIEDHDKISLGHEGVFNLLKDVSIWAKGKNDKLDNLSDIWDYLYEKHFLESNDISTLLNYAEIFEEYNVSPSILSSRSPSGKTFETNSPAPSFSWNHGNIAPSSAGNDEFEVIIFDESFSEVLRSGLISPNFSSISSDWTPSQIEWQEITGIPGVYNFVVTGVDRIDNSGNAHQSDEQLYPYWSGAQTFSVGVDLPGEPNDKLTRVVDGADESLTIAGQSLDIVLDKEFPLFGKLNGNNPRPSAQNVALAPSGTSGEDLNFIYQIRDAIVSNLRNVVGDNSEDIQRALFNGLGTNGLNVVRDLNEDGQINYRDIGYSDANNELRFDLKLGSDQSLYSRSVDFDFGIPGLGLSVADGSGSRLDFDLAYDFAFSFGIDSNDRFFFDTPDTEDLSFSLNASIPDLDLQGQLGFLQVNLTDEDADTNPDNDGLDVDQDGNNPTSLELGFSIDVEDSRFSNIRQSGFADLNLELETSFAGSAVFPSILTGLNIDWDFGNGQSPIVNFSNVQLDLGDFFSEFLAPVLQTVQTVTEPIEPIINALKNEIDLKVVSFSLLDIAELLGVLDDDDKDFIESLSQTISLINDIPAESNVILDLGSFDLGDFDITAPGSQLSDATPQNIEILDPVSQISEASPEGEFIQKVEAIPRAGLQLPILTDPTQAFNLLLSQDADLFTYELPTLSFEYSYRLPIPFGFVTGGLGGSLGAAIDLGFGFDTFGVRQFSETGDYGDVFDGFYISDPESPELSLFGSFIAFLELNLGIVSGGVDGGVFLDILFDLQDPDEDEKVRFEEFKVLAEASPLCIFETSGELAAGVGAYVRFGLGPFSYTKRFDLARFTLLNFNIGCAGTTDPILAFEVERNAPSESLFAGDLRLNVGPYAENRLFVDTTDGAEFFYVAHESGSMGNETVNVQSFGVTQSYLVHNTIFADAGAESDIIELADDVLTPARLFGREGNDIVIGGGGDDFIEGNEGFDKLEGRSGEDSLFGGDLEDVLIGGAGGDLIDGGDGLDVASFETAETGVFLNLFTGEATGDALGDQYISIEQFEGTRFDDTFIAGLDNSIFDGAEGNDTLQGNLGDDLLIGGAGADVLEGGEGNNSISYFSSTAGVSVNLETGEASGGDAEGDSISQISNLEGSEFDDLLFGTTLDNFMSGRGGNDTINAGEGSNEIYGGDGNDSLIAGSGDDIFFAGAGDNTVEAGDGNNTIEAGDGSDFLRAGSGNDIFDSGEGNDRIEAGGGNDNIAGNLGNDVIDGGEGFDTVNYTESPEGVTVNLLTNENTGGFAAGDVLSNVEKIVGSGFRDNLVGDAGDNVIAPGLSRGNNSRDDVDGGEGIDWLVVDYSVEDTGEGVVGSMGNVRRLTEVGNSRPLDSIQFRNIESIDFTGTKKNDTFNTRNSRDYDDILRGRGGNDTFRSYGGDDVLYGDEGDDFLDAHLGNDTVYGGEGNDTVFALRSNTRNSASSLESEDNVDVLDGGEGVDTLSVNLSNQSVDITLISNSLTDTISEVTFDNGTSIKNFEILDVIRTGSGNDYIVQKGDFSNIFHTGAGDDVIDIGIFGAGPEWVYAGEGNDTVIIDYADIDLGEGVLVTNQGLRPISSRSSKTFYSSVERFEFTGTRYDDDFRASWGSPNLAETGALDDVLSGGGGDDRLQGFRGNDQLNGDEGDDDLEGGEGQDTLNGGIGRDTLAGNDGDDILYLGNDTDQDTVEYRVGRGHDTLFEFVRGDGGDILDITASISSSTYYVDVITYNGDTELRIGEDANGRTPFGVDSGELLVTFNDLVGFTAADVGVNLVATDNVIFRFIASGNEF